MDKRPIIAGNWKMNKSPIEGTLFVKESINLLLDIKIIFMTFYVVLIRNNDIKH